MRLFYATYLSQENMDAYQALVDELILQVPGVLRSIPHRTHHLTLGFLGEIADGDVDKCLSALADVERFEAFEISLEPPSVLTGRGRPRLIRVGVTEGAEHVAKIQAALISRVSQHIPSIDTRSKPPHVTLARFNKNSQRSQAQQVGDVLERLADTPLPKSDRFSSVQLVKSSLTPSGPIYEALHEVRLGDRH